MPIKAKSMVRHMDREVLESLLLEVFKEVDLVLKDIV